MLCYHCDKANSCPTLRTLYSMSKDFCINECRDYNESLKNKYKKIAFNDDLMHLIYGYFTGQLEGCTEEKAKRVIISTIMDL